MSTKEQDFKDRLVAVMRDVKENLPHDPEAAWMIGSLAARLTDINKLKSWGEFKASLSRVAYDQLLKDFEQQGNTYHQEGKAKAAYAIQLLAISTIARTQTDPEVKQGEELLDGIINSTIAGYRKALATRAAKAN